MGLARGNQNDVSSVSRFALLRSSGPARQVCFQGCPAAIPRTSETRHHTGTSQAHSPILGGVQLWSDQVHHSPRNSCTGKKAHG